MQTYNVTTFVSSFIATAKKADDIVLELSQIICDSWGDVITDDNVNEIGLMLGKAWGERPTFSIIALACSWADLSRQQANQFAMGIAQGAAKKWDDKAIASARSSICQALNAAGYVTVGKGGNTAKTDFEKAVDYLAKLTVSDEEFEAAVKAARVLRKSK
jgi:hypothetical protein